MKSLQRIQEKQKKMQELKQTVENIKRLPSLCDFSDHKDSPSITVHQHFSLDGMRNSLSDLKMRLEEFCKKEFKKIPSCEELALMDLGPWSGVQVQVIEPDKGVQRGSACHSTNFLEKNTPGQGWARKGIPQWTVGQLLGDEQIHFRTAKNLLDAVHHLQMEMPHLRPQHLPLQEICKRRKPGLCPKQNLLCQPEQRA
ncbi:hypothetical protein QTP70_009159 [Hemibagrus guttatus]|uniref:TRIM8/14/16/25/29/45/65 coiled-coil region domain-containing protein n=1 Tax=Hemibagrus guttatus TaxID=175788 RepID=A0AAE0UM83_9TELE|nr:hypothetical protein QTP70_009159 [Hemibagrus guttatus]KAK3530207.1 hypothetical protein QTP86_018060 [Hemibagrus guttatus]